MRPDSGSESIISGFRPKHYRFDAVDFNRREGGEQVARFDGSISDGRGLITTLITL